MAGIEPAWTCARQILSLLCLPISPHSQFNLGIPPGIWTPTNSFGDWYAAITLGRHWLVLAVALESTIALLFLAGPCTWSTLTSISVFQCSYSASITWRKRWDSNSRRDRSLVWFQVRYLKPGSATFPYRNTLRAMPSYYPSMSGVA